SSFLADFESEDSFVFVSSTESVQQTVFVNVLLFSFQGSYRYCVSAATLISYQVTLFMSTSFFDIFLSSFSLSEVQRLLLYQLLFLNATLIFISFLKIVRSV
ncbi:hypothetical protein ACFPRA_13695, partial [Sporosarcina soli]